MLLPDDPSCSNKGRIIKQRRKGSVNEVRVVQGLGFLVLGLQTFAMNLGPTTLSMKLEPETLNQKP
jgi:hypothetical protein